MEIKAPLDFFIAVNQNQNHFNFPVNQTQNHFNFATKNAQL